MAPESNTPWDGVDRRVVQLPVGPTALKIANRVVEDGKTAAGEEDVRAGDLENIALKTRVDGILDLANRDEAKPELTPEQAYLKQLKRNFDSLPQLHQGVAWSDVEKSLTKDPENLKKLQLLDEKGHSMNVFGEKNGEFVFVSGWTDYNKVSPDHRNIVYDLEGQKLAEKRGYKPSGNAVNIAESIGVDMADQKFHEQLRQIVAINGWAWLKTGAATRKNGFAFFGYHHGIGSDYANGCNDSCSFRAVVRVKKA